MTEMETVLSVTCADGLHGRRKILSNAKRITKENVKEVVNAAYGHHLKNEAEINYLLRYYRGIQDVKDKVKIVRPEINNKVTVNRANEIVTFKVSYLLGEPVQYVSRGGEDTSSEKIDRLNEYMYAEGKAAKDKEVAEWAHIGGVGYRMVLTSVDPDEDECPLDIYTLDPRETFMIYHSGPGQLALAGVLRQQDEEGKKYFCVYTESSYFEIHGDVVEEHGRALKGIPIIEYVHNESRMGAFEVVLPLLNAINNLESNRLDGVQEFVNAFDVFQNCEITKDAYKDLTNGGGAVAIKSTVPGSESKVYRVGSELSQQGVQTAIDDAYDAILTICGMPNRNGGSSTSDTGAATIMRDGWSSAEARAKDTETLFARSERNFLKIALKILKDTADLDLKLSEIGLKFTRRNYSDIQSKAQVLAEMLNNSKIHPKLAFQACGLFVDAEDSYRISMEWYEEQNQKLMKSLKEEINAEHEEPVHDDGQGGNPPDGTVDEEV